ncbi:hypothetical protein ROHU_026166 [Labeo rohita]|uniref:Ig-like domain-containing protein n=1 Tax=Labeo rohita TaxID=84645 RepID=A0A498MBU5_LABRO|nr:hypothetical protein ROHU_026166 [Labeo rohita]
MKEASSPHQKCTIMETEQLAALEDVLLFRQKGIQGEEVEMKVRPGDNITLYCDRSLTVGSVIVWIRNCSHENQPSLIIDFTKWDLEILKRFSYIHKNYSKSYDLQITNISISDLGLYYCAELERKINKDEKGILSSSDMYYYGTRTTRLSLKGSAEILAEDVIKGDPKEKHQCEMNVLLFHHKIIYGEEVEMKVRPGDNITLHCDRSVTPGSKIIWIRNCSHENQPSLIMDFTIWDLEPHRFSSIHNSNSKSYDLQITNIRVSDLGLYYCAELERKCADEEVCYASLDVITKRQKQRKTKRVQSSDFSTYAQFYCFIRKSVEMKVRPGDNITLYCDRSLTLGLVIVWKRINGEEVEMKVRPGDNITLYCDRSQTFGLAIVWIRNCSHENQPSLIIDFTKWDLEILRFNPVHNNYSKSYDLQITNIRVSDLGLYYCAELEGKVNKDEKGILSRSEVYYYGTRTTRLSLKGSTEILTEDVIKGDPKEKHQCEMSKTGKICFHTEVSYRLLTSAHPYAKM